MSIPCNCSAGKSTLVMTGVVALVGVAALAWYLLRQGDARNVDPLEETDRRINELENSLHRLQDTFSHAVTR